MSDQLSQLLKAQNRALRESARALPIYERAIVQACDVRIVEVTEANGEKRYTARVSQCDRMNQNHRVYPQAELAPNIERAKALCPSGRMIGAVDHADMLAGGNLKDSPILWRSLTMKEDLSIDGEFAIVEAHSRGKDLKAQIDAGMAIGFSTVGYGQGRAPTDEERKKYGIPEGDEDATIITNYTLKKIDAVDDPSVEDAWTKTENVGQPEPVTMKTLEDLKRQFPEVYSLHEKAIADAVAAIGTKHEADMQAMRREMDAMRGKCDEMKGQCDKLRAAMGDSVTAWAKLGIEMPFREVSEKEAAEKIERLRTELAKADVALAEKDVELASLKAESEKAAKEAAQKAEVARQEAQKAEAAAKEAQRKADVKTRAVELLAGNRFAVQIQNLVDAQVEIATFDLAALESLVAAKNAEYEAVARIASDSLVGITGILTEPEHQGQSDAPPLEAAAEIAKTL